MFRDFSSIKVSRWRRTTEIKCRNYWAPFRYMDVNTYKVSTYINPLTLGSFVPKAHVNP